MHQVIMYSANVIALGLAAIKGTETEQRIAVLLYDDNFQVISSFELNQIASLTYHEGSLVGELDYTEKVIEQLQVIVAKAIDYSPLTIEKALVVTKHILIFGASKVIQPVRFTLGRHIEALQQYNTALLAQQQTGATGLIMRLKGGSVDKGGPVRELATIIIRLLLNDDVLQFERNTQADPNSLVPIGDRKKVSFISDEARLRYLKKKMEHEKLLEQRSNLAKASDGFGGGYMSRDGKAVVGAAHGIEEMIKMAQRDQQKFADESGYKAPEIDVNELRQYAHEFEQQHGISNQQPETDLLSLDHTTMPQSQGIYSSNLLDGNHHRQEADLLDFGSTTMNPTASIGNTASSGLFNADLFGSTDPYIAPSPDVGTMATAATVNRTSDLLNGMSISSTSDPFAATVSAIVEEPKKKAIMSSSLDADRFAALDVFADPSATARSTSTSQVMPTMSFTGLGGGGIANNAFSGLGDTKSAVNSHTMNSSMNNHNNNGMNAGMIPNNNDVGGRLNNLYGSSGLNGTDAYSGLGGGLSMMGMTSPKMMMPTTTANLSSIQISGAYVPPGSATVDENDIASGFVMGGTTGSGLEPLAAAPAVPPPPPPPPSPW